MTLPESWTLSSLGEECDLYQPKTIATKNLKPGGKFPVYGANGQIGWYDDFNHLDSEVLLSCRGNCGTVNISQPKSWINGNAMVCRPKTGRVTKQYLALYLQSVDWKPVITGTAQPQITRQPLAAVALPVPPLEEQLRIVATLEDHLSRLDKALAEVTKASRNELVFKRSLLHSMFDELDGEVLPLGEVSQPRYGKDVPKNLRDDSLPIPVVGSAGVMTYTSKALVQSPSVLVGRKGNVGAVQKFEVPCSPVDTAYYLVCPEDVSLDFLYYQLLASDLKSLDSSTAIPSLRRQDLESVPFKKPSMQEQLRVASSIRIKLAELDSALAQLSATSNNINKLRRSLLRAAFNGELAI